MRRREFVVNLGLAGAWPLVAQAQPAEPGGAGVALGGGVFAVRWALVEGLVRHEGFQAWFKS